MLLSFCVAHKEREIWWRRDYAGSEIWVVWGHRRRVNAIYGKVSLSDGLAIF